MTLSRRNSGPASVGRLHKEPVFAAQSGCNPLATNPSHQIRAPLSSDGCLGRAGSQASSFQASISTMQLQSPCHSG